LISPNQTAFLKGRYILESVVAAHEIIPEVAHGDQAGFIFKLDYEKAYDRVNREFLIKMMTDRGLAQDGFILLRLCWIMGQWE
jgi:hypothetical protein